MMVYPLVNKQFAIENGPVEIVDLPINSMVILHSYVNVYQSNGKSYQNGWEMGYPYYNETPYLLIMYNVGKAILWTTHLGMGAIPPTV